MRLSSVSFGSARDSVHQCLDTLLHPPCGPCCAWRVSGTAPRPRLQLCLALCHSAVVHMQAQKQCIYNFSRANFLNFTTEDNIAEVGFEAGGTCHF